MGNKFRHIRLGARVIYMSKMIDSWDSTTKLLASVFSDIDGSRDGGMAENKTEASADSENDLSSCLRDRSVNWLERWWSSSHSNVKNRVASNKHRLGRDRQRGKVAVSNISLEEFVSSESVPKDIYFVSLNAPQGVGMNLFVSYEGLVLVQGLYKLRNGQSSPAQNCGVISVGDQLVRLNDINIEALSFYETTDLLKDLDLLAKNQVITLGFRYMDMPPVLPEEPEVALDYVDVESEGASEEEEEEDEQSLHLVPLSSGQSADLPVPHLPTQASNQTTPLVKREKTKRDSSAHKSQMEQYLQRERQEQQQREEKQNQQHQKNSTSIDLRQSPMVEDAFLALFAMDAPAPVHAAPSSAKHGALLSGMFPSFHEKTLKQRPDPTPFTSELDTVQNGIRRRHLYPTAARVSSIASVTHEPQVLQDLAEEIYEWRPLQYSRQFAGFYAPRAADDVGTEHSAVLSTLIASPQDRARYKYTEHLEWDDAQQCYVVPAPVPSQSLLTFVDCAGSMQGVLLNLELEARRSLYTTPPPHVHPVALSPVCGVSSHESQDSLCVSDTAEGATSNDSSDKLAGFLNTREQASPRTPPPSKNARQTNAKQDSLAPSVAAAAMPQTPIEAVSEKKVTIGAGRSSIVMHGACATAAHTPGQIQAQAKLTVKHVPYRTNSVAKTKQPFYYIKQDQLISAEHSSVQKLLAQPSQGVLTALSAAVDAEIANMTDVSEHNPFHNAKHFDSGHELSIPPMLLTYQLLYAAQQLKPVLLQNQALLTVIERWAATFDPKGINHALRTQFSPRNKTIKKASRKSTSPVSSPRNSLEPARKQEFLVYFNNDLQTVRDLLPFVEVVSELLTFLLLSRVAPCCLSVSGTRLQTPDLGDQSVMGRSFRSLPLAVDILGKEAVLARGAPPEALYPDAVAASCVRKFGLLLFLDTIAVGASSAGYVVTLEAVLDVSAAEVSHGLRAELLQSLVAQSVGTMLSAQQLIDKLSTAQGASEAHPPARKAPFLLCLLLQHLPVIFAQNTQLALDLTTLLYPQISPWNVQQALFPPDEPQNEEDGNEFADIPHVSAVSSITPSPVSSPRSSLPVPAFPSAMEAAAGDVRMSQQTARDLDRILTRSSSNQSVLTADTALSQSHHSRVSRASRDAAPYALLHAPRGGLCAQNSFYSYLTRLFRNRAELCATRPDLILAWLDAALGLAKQDGVSSFDFQPFQNPFATPRGKKKNPFCITVRNILHTPEQYYLPVVAGMQMCAAYEHFEGVKLLGERLRCNSDGLILPPADLSVALSVVTQAVGGEMSLLLSLVCHLQASEIVNEKSRSRDFHLANASHSFCISTTTSRDSQPSDQLPALCTTTTALLRLLASAVRALCHNGSAELTAPARKFDSPEWQVFGDVLNQLVHERFYETPQLISGDIYDRSILSIVSNLFSECLRFAIGTENALVVLQNAPVLADLI